MNMILNKSYFFLLILAVLLFLKCGCDGKSDFSSIATVLQENASLDEIESYLKKYNGLTKADLTAKKHPLLQAIQNGDPNIVELLLKYNTDPNAESYGTTAIMEAMIDCKTEMIKALLSAKADPKFTSQNEDFPLYFASKSGCLAGVEILLQNGVDIDRIHKNHHENSLSAALMGGHIDIVAFLIEKGANIIFHNPYDIYDAYQDHSSKVAEIIKTQPKILQSRNDAGFTVLHKLANLCETSMKEQCQFDKINTFIALCKENGLSLEVKTNGEKELGRTPLHIAASNAHKKMVELLLNNGAQINAKSAHNITTLHLASILGIYSYQPSGNLTIFPSEISGYKEMIALLLEKGADVTAKDSSGATALHYAVTILSNAQLDIVTLLLKNKADPNASDSEGQTPLHVAINKQNWGDLEKNKALIELLDVYGADPKRKNKAGYSPMELIREDLKKSLGW